MKARGFILQPTYRVEAGRPVVHLYGRLDSGETFLVRDAREVPHFYVRASDAARARELGASPLTPAGKRTLRGEPVVRVEVALPADSPALRDRLFAAGIPCYEADVPFATRYLVDRGIRGSLEIEGESRAGEGVSRVFEDPDVRPSDWTPAPSVLSFDIETDPRASRLLAVSLHGCGASEMLLLAPPGRRLPPAAQGFDSERRLIEAFCRRVRQLDPDVLTGWNVVDFDLAVLSRIADRCGARLELGRGPGPVRVIPAAPGRGASRATVPGRVVLDGIQLLRGAFVRMEDYSLDAVAREVLGEGKLVAARGLDRAEEILRLYEEDLARFVEYGLADARLALDVVRRLELVELAVERSRLTGMPLDRVASSVAAFDFLYLSELGRRGVVAPTVRAPGEPAAPTTGGHVLEPQPGVHANVIVLDFKSLYPSIIRTFQVDPLGYVPEPRQGDDVLVAPNGAAFRREPGILTLLLDELFPRREAAKREGDAVASQAIKILMNSFYGVLGTPACRFHEPALANAITSFGREILLWSKSRIESCGYRVLYGDTDSLFVLSGVEDPAEARRAGQRLAEIVTRDLADHVRQRWRVASRLELKFEALYLKLLLPAARHGTAGARKRYAGLVETEGERRTVFVGMEVVRRDWTELAKRVQRELYERLFADRPVEGYLLQVIADLRAGRLDPQLVYRKALRKGLDEYTATTPPHVAAARKMQAEPGRLVAYVMTTEGPEPASDRRHPLDYEHYVEKQVRPVAEPVLSLLGLDFDRLLGHGAQARLF